MPTVTFNESGVSAPWSGEHDNILELAEAEGLNLDFGCRMGNCTACQQPLVSGEVNYPDGHGGEPDDGNILICCSVPKDDVVIDA
ncbi:MAG: 2Fe-2S iron-sulfur cluster-binding protein [Verrucomicrobiota bacterium]